MACNLTGLFRRCFAPTRDFYSGWMSEEKTDNADQDVFKGEGGNVSWDSGFNSDIEDSNRNKIVTKDTVITKTSDVIKFEGKASETIVLKSNNSPAILEVKSVSNNSKENEKVTKDEPSKSDAELETLNLLDSTKQDEESWKNFSMFEFDSDDN